MRVCSDSSSSMVRAWPSSLMDLACWSSAVRMAMSCWFWSFSALEARLVEVDELGLGLGHFSLLALL
jgi:hypothetical protein